MIVVVVTEEGYLNPVSAIDVTGGTNQGIMVGNQQVGSGSTEQNVEMWRIMESDISDGVNTIKVHFGSTPSGAGLSLMSFFGVKQQPEEAEVSNVITSYHVIATEITTLTPGSLIVSAAGHGQTNSLYMSHGLGQIERHNYDIPSAGQAVTTEIKALVGPDIQTHIKSSSANRQAQYVASFAPSIGPSTETTNVTPRVHVGDLDITNSGNNRWTGLVTITTHQDGDKPISGVVVSGNWSGGSDRFDSCATDSAGQCQVSQRTRGDSLTFTVNNISGGVVYAAAANHDSESDSDGTSITINKNGLS